MFESALLSALVTIVVLIAFMVACPVLCFCFSIFSDSINVNGIFEKAGIAFVNLIFIPFVLFFKIVDAFTSPTIEPKMKHALENINSLR